jgi:peptidyl-prolyl cis-trans isomerase C
VAARVGDTSVSAAAVARIAAAQQISTERARDAAIRDALLANEALALGIGSEPSIQVATSAAFARHLLVELYGSAETQGPVTDDELRDATALHWVDLDRPPAYRTVHALVRLDDKAGGDTRSKAQALADAIHRAVAPVAEQARSISTGPNPGQPGSADPLVASFTKSATSVPAEGLQVIVEPLPPMTADGRGLDEQNSTFDKKFAQAAAALDQRGALSEVTPSPFGLHVIMLLDRIEPKVVPAEERRRLVHDEVIAGRARAAKEKLLDRLRSGAAIERNADSLLALVPIER